MKSIPTFKMISVLFLFSCATPKAEQNQAPPKLKVVKLKPQITKIDQCDYSKLKGPEVIFATKMKASDYKGFCFKTNSRICKESVPYAAYQGKKAKYTNDVVVADGTTNKNFRKMILENCEVLYFYRPSANDSEFRDWVYATRAFISIDEVNQDKKRIGKKVWLNHDFFRKKQMRTYKSKHGQIRFDHWEGFTLQEVSIDPKEYLPGYTYGVKIYWRLVSSQGKIGIIEKPIKTEAYAFKNPMNPRWPKAIITAINQREIFVGMTKQQLKVALGEPDKRRPGKSGKEQWWYKSRRGWQLVLVYNNKIVDIQQ